KSTQAKNKINQWFKHELKDDNIVKGKELIANYCKAKSINQLEVLIPKYQEAIMKKYGFQDWDSVLAAIGHGGLKEGQIINRMQEMYENDHRKEMTDAEVMAEVAESAQINRDRTQKGTRGIIVKGIHDVAVRFSKCCSPVPGDEIVGFVTRGRGISIHRTDCMNIMNLPEIDRNRLIDAEWQQTEAAEGKYFAEISIFANNRNGLLADISKALTEKEIDILSLNTRVSKQGTATIMVSFEIRSREELQRIIDKIRTIESIIDIERTTG
ncbi:MAG: ACT domain-containing protein, partial [Lachnospiraceae bacterium]|nr:ACT domain-containing protein [Lachnospiraceae bacterium]